MTDPRPGALTALLIATLLGGAPIPLSAQVKEFWAPATAIGFGGLGCGAGHLIVSEAARDRENTGRVRTAGILSNLGPLGTLGGCFLGAYIGWRLGAEADELLEEGLELSTGTRRGVRLGTVLAGATVGTLISLIPASTHDGRKTEITVTYALVGAGLGAVFQLALNRRLYPKESPPDLQLGLGAEGGLSVGLAYRF